ncbi:hypothetical protein ACFRKE_12005 [Kitasatospora indigofera]|uniref:hypothetical protein n=1 Tax=Kitasatospora indigofera TaxID=67307 RepID=UPI003630C66E
MRKRLLPPGGLRGKARETGKHLRSAHRVTAKWLASPAGKGTVRIAVELLKLCLRFKGIDIDLLGDDPLKR